MSRKVTYIGMGLLLGGLISWTAANWSCLLLLKWAITSGILAETSGYNWFDFFDWQQLLLTIWVITSVVVSFLGFIIALIGTRRH